MESGARPGMIILPGSSHSDLCQNISERLNIPLGKVRSSSQNRETLVEIGDSVRQKHVYIIQTGTKDVNNDLMELMIMAYACRTAAAKKVIGVIPYLPYCKQSKMRKRGCIVSKLMAKMLTQSGIKHIITMDLHLKEIQGFFDCPVDNLRASPFFVKYIEDYVPNFKSSVIVARNANAVRRATSYVERLHIGIAIVHGEDKALGQDGDLDGRSSPPLESDTDTHSNSGISDAAPSLSVQPISPGPASHPPHTVGPELLPMLLAKEKPPLSLVGDVCGRNALIVDDLIDDATPFIKVAQLLKQNGALRIYLLATHGLFSGDAPQLLQESCIDEIVVTNTVPHEEQKLKCSKIRTIDVAMLLSEAIRRIHYDESMSYLFRNIGTDD